MPVIDSMAVAAMAMPYRPAREYAAQIATHTASTGSAVDFMETPSPGDDVGRVAGLRCGGDVTHRAVFGRGVVLGDDHHRGGERQADQRGAEQRQRSPGPSATA